VAAEGYAKAVTRSKVFRCPETCSRRHYEGRRGKGHMSVPDLLVVKIVINH
jgi:hypothetical protein